MKLTFSYVHAYSLAAFITIASVLASSHSHADSAAFYKCIDANGNTTYNDSACAANESTKLISRHATTIAALDCRIAQNFIVDSTARWQQGNTRKDLYSTYGGANTLSTEVVRMIDYLYSFSGESLSVNRIIGLATQRCEAGYFGDLVAKCDTYPKPFIDSFGSCIKARQPESNVVIRSEFPAAASNSFTTPPTLGAANPVNPMNPANTAQPVEPPKKSRHKSR